MSLSRRSQTPRAVRLVSALALLLLAACTVPTLREVEQAGPLGCDDGHACVDGYTCVRNKCVANGAMPDCFDGDTRLCGLTRGACRQGTQTCTSGKFGACVGSIEPAAELCDGLDNDCDGMTDEDVSQPACLLQQGVCMGTKKRCVTGGFAMCDATEYGTNFEQNTETRCDGLDNDCDGMTDEGLMVQCPVQRGVCQGATTACVGAGTACTPSDYRRLTSNYELLESKCDGLDNDCDGLADGTTAVLTAAAGARNVSGARVSGDAGVVLIYEAASKVKARVLLGDGTLSAEVEPAATVANASSAVQPTVASDGQLVYGAWVERIAGIKRVMVAQLDPVSGRSTLPNAAAFNAGNDDPDELALAVNEQTRRVMLAWTSDGGITLAGFPADLALTDGGACNNAPSPTCAFRTTTVPGSNAAHVNLTRGKSFVASWTIDGGVSGCRVSDLGQLSCLRASVPGDWSTVFADDDGGTRVFFAETVDGGTRVGGLACDGGLVCAPVSVPRFPQTASAMERLRFSGPGLEFASWQTDAGVAGSFVSSVPVVPGQRPSPTLLQPGLGLVFFEADAGLSVLRACLP